ncbi:carboxymuconolactone decarboxylase family protein [Arthrobacter sp. NPDC056493]|uniref:carboxymuconolactone decarboxylase family protein n=1 Tax=Arthrobacter sp. NPDC056493 TaxID=3345839 RepID=UPI00366E19A9
MTKSEHEGQDMNSPGRVHPLYRAVPQLGRLRDDVLFGDVWEQAELSPRDRSLVTCAVLASNGNGEELTNHLKRAVDNGVTVDELRGLVVQVAFYAGWPAGLCAAKAGLELFTESAGDTGDDN